MNRGEVGLKHSVHLTDGTRIEFHGVRLPTEITPAITSYQAFTDFTEFCHLVDPERYTVI